MAILAISSRSVPITTPRYFFRSSTCRSVTSHTSSDPSSSSSVSTSRGLTNPAQQNAFASASSSATARSSSENPRPRSRRSAPVRLAVSCACSVAGIPASIVLSARLSTFTRASNPVLWHQNGTPSRSACRIAAACARLTAGRNADGATAPAAAPPPMSMVSTMSVIPSPLAHPAPRARAPSIPAYKPTSP